MIGKKVPKSFGPKFKAKHRAALRAAERAVSAAELGCVYSPAYRQIIEAVQLLAIARKACSVKNWGRR